MSLPEQWMSEVEHQLRRLKDVSITQSSRQIEAQSRVNMPGFSRSDSKPTSTANQDSKPDSDEIIYIRLISYRIINGEVLYSWKRQVKRPVFDYVYDGENNNFIEFIWVDSGESGNAYDRPAMSLNGNNASIPFPKIDNYPTTPISDLKFPGTPTSDIVFELLPTVTVKAKWNQESGRYIFWSGGLGYPSGRVTFDGKYSYWWNAAYYYNLGGNNVSKIYMTLVSGSPVIPNSGKPFVIIIGDIDSGLANLSIGVEFANGASDWSQRVLDGYTDFYELSCGISEFNVGSLSVKSEITVPNLTVDPGFASVPKYSNYDSYPYITLDKGYCNHKMPGVTQGYVTYNGVTTDRKWIQPYLTKITIESVSAPSGTAYVNYPKEFYIRGWYPGRTYSEKYFSRPSQFSWTSEPFPKAMAVLYSEPSLTADKDIIHMGSNTLNAISFYSGSGVGYLSTVPSAPETGEQAIKFDMPRAVGASYTIPEIKYPRSVVNANGTSSLVYDIVFSNIKLEILDLHSEDPQFSPYFYKPK